MFGVTRVDPCLTRVRPSRLHLALISIITLINMAVLVIRIEYYFAGHEDCSMAAQSIDCPNELDFRPLYVIARQETRDINIVSQ
jgi:hypothetical protein